MEQVEATMNATFAAEKIMSRLMPFQVHPRRTLVLTILLGLGLGACVAGDGNVAPQAIEPSLGTTNHASTVNPRPAPPPPVVPALTSIYRPPPGFSNERIIGLVRAIEECPVDNADWERIAGLERNGLARSDGNHFCGFRWRHAGTVPNADTAPPYCPKNARCCSGATATCLPPAVGATWLEPDDGGVYVSALPAEAHNIIAGAIRTQHRAAMGTPAVFPRGKNHFTDLPRKIKVYVLDNSDENHPGVHGDAVASWIKQTACPDGDCGLWIQKRKVIDDDGKGNVVTLADTIMAAVDDAAGWPALINLSLQIHPTRVFEAQSTPNATDDVSNHLFRFPHQMLETALNYARCHGVLVIAAAGNRDGGSAPFRGYGLWGENLAYPAALGRMSQPWACGGESEPAPGESVVAVGGIAADGSDASSRRENGQACLVAPSVALTADGAPLEGTSFSAAAITGAVAAVWRYAPFATGYGAFTMLRQHAQVIPRGPGSLGCNASSLESQAGHSDAYRINLCKGIKKALHLTYLEAEANSARKIYKFARGMHDALTCTETISVDAKAKISVGQGALLSGTAQELALARSFVGGVSSVPQAGLCGGSLFADGSHRNELSCPAEMMHNGTILADGPGTSPGGIGCSGCSVALLANNSLWFYGSLYGSWITSPSLSLGLNASSAKSGAPMLLSTGNTVERTYELGNVLGEHEREPEQSFAILIAENVVANQLVEASFSYRIASETGETGHVAGLPIIQVVPPP